MRIRLKELRRARKRSEERHKITVAAAKPKSAKPKAS